MASRRPAAPPPVVPKLQLTPAAIQKGIERLGQRIGELRAFDTATVPTGRSPELDALSAAIKDTLERYVGENTSAYKRFEPAAQLSWHPMVIAFDYRTPPHEYVQGVTHNIARAVALLQEAQRVLRDDLEDAQPQNIQAVAVVEVAPQELSRRVFVVHGHDEEAKQTVARFLGNIGFEPIILHEQPNQGRTIIEKFEVHGDVGFAVVLLTPDDQGGPVGGPLEPRARQNVILELGYFIGKLTRSRVLVLKRGEVAIPSDYFGVLWQSLDDSGWKAALGTELEEAGYGIDWKKVMRS